jgi:hypothetical protein
MTGLPESARTEVESAALAQLVPRDLDGGHGPWAG